MASIASVSLFGEDIAKDVLGAQQYVAAMFELCDLNIATAQCKTVEAVARDSLVSLLRDNNLTEGDFDATWDALKIALAIEGSNMTVGLDAANDKLSKTKQDVCHRCTLFVLHQEVHAIMKRLQLKVYFAPSLFECNTYAHNVHVTIYRIKSFHQFIADVKEHILRRLITRNLQREQQQY